MVSARAAVLEQLSLSPLALLLALACCWLQSAVLFGR